MANLRIVVSIYVWSVFVASSFQDFPSENVERTVVTKLQSNEYEVSKLYAQKLIEKFSDRNAMTMKEFEKMLIELEKQNIRLNDSSSSCVDGMKLWSLVESQPNLTNFFAIDADHIISICPMLLYHISTQESLSGRNTCLQPPEHEHESESRASVWFFSTLALLGISLCGLLGVVVIPIVDKNYYFYVLQYFMALAVGTLTGDALLHLLPHAMRPASGELSSAETIEMMTRRGIAAMLGIILFSFLERILSMITKCRSGKSRTDQDDDPAAEKLHKSHGHSHGLGNSQSDSLSSIVWMVILGDGLHNFTDGMAIGAAFSNNIAGGFSTTVAVFCHELPHELGDFAILLKAGMSARKAIYYNILSSILSFLGMCVGISIGDTPETTQWIFAVAAGMFIYIALVDMVRCNFRRLF